MGGSESKFVTEMLDNPAMKEKFYKEMRFDKVDKQVQDEVEKNLRAADIIVNKKKEEYGLGVSVKGVVVNMNVKHALVLDSDLCMGEGKDWSDPQVLQPKDTVRGTDSSPFFHAKVDGAMRGSAAAFQYAVKDVDNEHAPPARYLAVSWFNPYNDNFRSKIVLSDEKVDLKELLKETHKVSAGKHESLGGSLKNLSPEAQKEALRGIETFMDETDHSTSYLVVAIQGSNVSPKN